MLLRIDRATVDAAPLVPRVPAGVASKAASAGRAEALSDWLASALKRKAVALLGDEAKASEAVNDLLSKVNVRVEFV